MNSGRPANGNLKHRKKSGTQKKYARISIRYFYFSVHQESECGLSIVKKKSESTKLYAGWQISLCKQSAAHKTK